jgi:hypothetical protein
MRMIKKTRNECIHQMYFDAMKEYSHVDVILNLFYALKQMYEFNFKPSMLGIT